MSAPKDTLKATGLNLTGKFLLATPSIELESIFHDSLIYIIEHDTGGAAGIIVNKPSGTKVAELLSELELEDCSPGKRLSKSKMFFGGPVLPNNVLIVHEAWKRQGRKKVRTIGFSWKIDKLRELCSDESAEKAMIAIGYSGWGAGQLENEVGRNSWLHVDADPEILFDTMPDKRLSRAAAKLGFKLESLSHHAGQG